MFWEKMPKKSKKNRIRDRDRDPRDRSVNLGSWSRVGTGLSLCKCV